MKRTNKNKLLVGDNWGHRTLTQIRKAEKTKKKVMTLDEKQKLIEQARREKP